MTGPDRGEPLSNWAGTITFTPAAVETPRSVEEVVAAVARAGAVGTTVKVLGTGHSFSAVADTDGILLRSAGLRSEPILDRDGRVTCGAGTPYSELVPVLHAAGRALPNLGSLPHISVGGALATGTHGSGPGNQVLAAQVSRMQVVRADASVTDVDGDDLREQVIGLGALGVVTEVTLQTVQAFTVRQEVRPGLATDALVGNLDEILSAGYSVSVFTDYRTVHEVWIKAAADAPLPGRGWLGTTPATEQRPAGPGADPAAGTAQLGVPGPWHERLPHFRADFRPSNGAEIQSEYFVAREHGAAALAALCDLGDEFADVLHVGEVRAVAADELLLSGASGRDTVALHFTWRKDAARVRAVLEQVETALAPYGARPHWGKVFVMDPATVTTRHPGVVRFGAVRGALDPHNRFGNAFLDRYLPRA